MNKKGKGIIITIICAAVIIAAAIIGTVFVFRAFRTDAPALQTATPVYEAMEETVRATGTLKNNENYTITSAATGKVIECNFEEGDSVTAGQVLYRIDSDALSRQLEQAKISLEQARATRDQSASALNDLTVRSYVGGMVSKVYVHNGDMVQAGAKIADVTDQENLILKAPFHTTDIPNIYIGAAVEITLASTGGACWGTVSKIYDAPQAFDGGKAGTMVEIAVTNPGALKDGETAYARIGTIASAAAGTFENSVNQSIVAAASGQVENLAISEGARVSKSQCVLTLKNDALRNALTNAELQIKQVSSTITQLTDQLKDYVVTSPIDGVVTSKTVKLYDNNAAMTPMAVIADTAHLYAEVNIDELNAPKVQPGQAAQIMTQDEAQSYTGVVTQIAEAGTPVNGVTYFPVKIMLDDHTGLIDGMNVDVQVTVGQHEHALTIPADALKGNKVKVVGEHGVEERRVEVGIKNGKTAEILSGLSESDQIVIGGGSHE